MVNRRGGRTRGKRWSRWALAAAAALAILSTACGSSSNGESPTATVTAPPDTRDYSKFSPDAAMLSVDDLPAGFSELPRQPPAVTGTDIVGSALYRFATETHSHYVFSEVVLLKVEAQPVYEEFLRTRMQGLGLTNIESATVDYPEPGSTFVRGEGTSDILGSTPQANTTIPVVFEVVSFVEGKVTAMVGRWYPSGDSPEPSLPDLAQIVLGRIRAQLGNAENGQGQ